MASTVVHVAPDGETASRHARNGLIDVVLFDIMKFVHLTSYSFYIKNSWAIFFQKTIARIQNIDLVVLSSSFTLQTWAM